MILILKSLPVDAVRLRFEVESVESLLRKTEVEDVDECMIFRLP